VELDHFNEWLHPLYGGVSQVNDPILF
jgi:hypothetical protein